MYICGKVPPISPHLVIHPLKFCEQKVQHLVYTCPTPLSGSEVLGEETQLLELHMQALMEQEDSEVLHHAALLGNLTVIREYLDKYPNEVIK